MPQNPYDAWLDEMFGPVGQPQPEPRRQAPASPSPFARRRRRPQPEEEAQQPEISDGQWWGAMGARGLGGMFGFTPWTGAAGGAAGELAAQAIEQWDLTPEVDLKRVAGEAAAGAAGGQFAKMLGGLVGAPVKAALSGALLGGVSPVLRHGFGEGKWDPREYAGEVGLAAGLSGLTGGAVAKFTGAAPILGKATGPAGPSYDVVPTQTPGGRSFQQGGVGINQPVHPIPGSGSPQPTLLPPTRAPKDLETGGPTPYVGMPSVTQKQQRMIEAEQKAAQKAADEAARARQIQEQMAEQGLSRDNATYSFGESISAKQPDGSTLRMSTRFAAEDAADAAKKGSGTTPQQGRPAPTVPEVDEVEAIRQQIAAIEAQMAGDAASGLGNSPARAGLKEILGAYPPARSQAVGVPEMPPQAPFTPELPPSAAVQAPEAPSGLAKVLGAGKKGKKPAKTKAAKFDDAVSKILGQTDEIPPTTPREHAAYEALEDEAAREVAEMAQPVADDVFPATFHKGNRADVSGENYRALQSLFKAGQAPKEAARLAGKALRGEAQAAGLPIGKAAAKPAASLEEMLNASVKATGAPDTVPPVPGAPAAAAQGDWIAQEQAEISRLAALPKEQRAQAFLEGPLSTKAPDAPAPTTSTGDAEPDWVKQAMAEVDELGAQQAAQPKSAPKVAETASSSQNIVQAEDLGPIKELRDLLMKSGAIKNPQELGSWMDRLRTGEKVMPEGPPPPVAPKAEAPKGSGRGRLRTTGTREDAPLPQDYSPTPAGKPGKAQAAAPTGGKATSKEFPFAVAVGSGKTQVSKGFATQEEATEFLNAARETGKFKDIRLISAADEAKTNLKPRLNKGKKGEAGFSDVRLLSSILGGGLGAAAGGAADDEDPIRGALLGAAGGAAVGATLPMIAQGLTKIGVHEQTIAETVERLQHDGNTHQAAAKITKTLPQWVRFNYLMDGIGLPANAAAGPWGSGVFGTLERALAGDPRAWGAFTEIVNPWNFLKEIPSAYHEARTLVGRSEGYALSEASTAAEKTLSWPGTLLTAGDVAVRRILQRHGFSDDEARIMTLTGEPFTKSGQKGTHLGGLAWDLTFPFKRTPINVVEQGMLRTPVIGSIMQGVAAARGTRAADPFRQQLIQQGIGGGVYLGADQLGQNMDPDTARVWRRYVSNVGGPYSLLASLGFTVGQAKNRGVQSIPREVVRTLPYNLPMPSLEPIQDAARFAFEPEFDEIPRGAYPKAAYEQLMRLLQPEPENPLATANRRR